MEKGRKFLSIIIIFILVSYCLFSLFSNPTYAANQVISTDVNAIDEAAYPGFKERINALKAQFPNWNFKILYTDLDWNEVISEEYVGHGNSPRNQVQAISNYQGAWICPCGFAAGSWRCASEDAIKYMMDPRNSLNASDIFQFEELTNNGYDMNQIINMTNGTFLQGHYEEITRAGNNTGISPYFIIARMLQEQGKGGTALTSGVYGYYNPFNIQANGADPISNGVAYAQSQGWDTLEKGITGGIEFLSREYTKRGQNTLYLQKFDVDATSDGLYWHQYMQNIMAAQSEGTTLRKTYESINAVGDSHTFIIPVYRNMPRVACSRPDGSSNPIVSTDIVKVNVNSTICLRSSPNGPKINAFLYKDEIVTRIEKATTKVAGTYWDKIRKADGTEAYVARETYDYETEYKLYLVPINDNTSNDSGNSGNTSGGNEVDNSNDDEMVSTEKVKVDKASKTVTVGPDAIARDIIDAFGSIKITKANGDLLEGEHSVIGTDYVIKDKYRVIKKGDVSGDGYVNSADLLGLQKHLLGITNIMNTMKGAGADVTNDGNLNSADLLKIQKKLLGISDLDI